MDPLTRCLELKLPKGQSAFLWGPRKTGKTTWLRQLFPESLSYDLLQTDLALTLLKEPARLRQELLAAPAAVRNRPVILDEVQKVPAILDEVHWLIENAGFQFILCGSSARKLKAGQANLLGGRAWRAELFPLVSAEIPDLDLLRALNHGLIPSHYLQKNHERSLRAYVQDYLKEEVFAEGLTRNLPAFSRFFEAMGYSHGELTNYTNIARDCGVDAKTVKEYYQILVDTLIGNYVLPYSRRSNRQVITKAPKFYLFDTGVAGFLMRRTLKEERGESFGRAFEHFIYMELIAHRSYRELHYNLRFWRTRSGLEVDFILGEGEIAVEVKGASRVDQSELRGIRAFAEEYKPRRAIVVANEPRARQVGDIQILPWRRFLADLWAGKIIH